MNDLVEVTGFIDHDLNTGLPDDHSWHPELIKITMAFLSSN
jgi:hypothetical protein